MCMQSTDSLSVHACDYVLSSSMAGGELFDRIQKKGHFTERGIVHVYTM